MNILKQYRYLIVAIMIVMTGCASVSAKTGESSHHYYDLHQNSLEQYDVVWDMLHRYYGEHLPHVLTVLYIEGNSSRFDPNSDQIKLSLKHLYLPLGILRLVAHESSHVGLHHFTKGASSLERFRFFDEGLANIMGAIAADNLKAYKQHALQVATEQQRHGNVSFEKVQQWSSYYGKPELKTTSYAYHVGASFDFFVMDRYGEERFWQFLEDIGSTRDLENTSRNVFDMSMEELEKGWLQYLADIELDPACVIKTPTGKIPGHLR